MGFSKISSMEYNYSIAITKTNLVPPAGNRNQESIFKTLCQQSWICVWRRKQRTHSMFLI